MLLGVAHNGLLSDDEPVTHDLLWSLIIHRAHLYDEQIEWAHELDDGLEVAYRELHLHRLHQDAVYGLPYHWISLHSQIEDQLVRQIILHTYQTLQIPW